MGNYDGQLMAPEMDPQTIVKVSVVMPTYNAERTLRDCLHALCSQDYPRERVEILIVDGNSTDQTRTIAREYGAIVLENPERAHPQGRVIGIHAATGDLILCLDSDNLVVGSDWLARMVAPFADPTISAAEPLYYTATREDGTLTRYCALIGADDPLIVYLGFHERFSYLTNTWTRVPHAEQMRTGYRAVTFTDPRAIPSLGANGYMVRASALRSVRFDPFYHMDVAYRLINAGYNRIAKVDVGLIHRHSDTIGKFIVKKYRRVARRLDRSVVMEYQYPITRGQMALLGLRAFLVAPLLVDAIRGYWRKNDSAWLYHPLVAWCVFWLYAGSIIVGFFHKSQKQRYETV